MTARGADDAVVMGMATPAVRAMMIGLWLLTVFHTLVSGILAAHPWVLVPLAAGLGGAIVFSRPGERLDRRASGWLVCCETVAAVVVFAYATPGTDLAAYTYATFLASAQIGRGNRRAGALAAVIICVIGAMWGFSRGFAPWENAALLLPVALPLVFFGLSVVQSRYVAGVRTQRSRAAHERVAEVAADHAKDASRSELARIRTEVAPLLRRIRDGEPLDDDLKTEILLAEATIRDRIRSPRLQHPRLSEVTLALRRQGTSVLLLGEMEGAAAELDARLIEAAVAHLSDVPPGSSVTVRVLPGAARGALTIVITGPHRSDRVVLSADGGILERR